MTIETAVRACEAERCKSFLRELIGALAPQTWALHQTFSEQRVGRAEEALRGGSQSEMEAGQ